MGWLDEKFIDDWQARWHRLWSVRVAICWAAFSGFVVVLPWFANVLPSTWWALIAFAVFNSLMCVVLVLARLAKQPGSDINE